MAKKIVIPLVVILACGLLLAGSATAANGFAISRHAIGGGGQRAAGGGYILHGTIGEPVASGFGQGATYGLSSGFWWPPQYRIYLPLVLRNY
jgi:hypothetical protein